MKDESHLLKTVSLKSLRAVPDSSQSHSALYGTALSDWDNTSLLFSISTHFHSSFLLNGKYSLLKMSWKSYSCVRKIRHFLWKRVIEWVTTTLNSCFALTFNNSCPRQRPVSLRAVPDSGQFHSALSWAALSDIKLQKISANLLKLAKFFLSMNKEVICKWIMWAVCSGKSRDTVPLRRAEKLLLCQKN